MLEGHPIPIYGDGSTARDYTYVSDTVEGILAAIAFDQVPYEVLNLGNSRTTKLCDLGSCLEEVLGTKAQLDHIEEQSGDVPLTYADISKARRMLGYAPATQLETGIQQFSLWLRSQLAASQENEAS